MIPEDAKKTYVRIDKDLLAEARRLGGHVTKKEAMTAALRHYVRWRRQMPIFDLAGKVQFDPTYDYKAERRRDMKDLEQWDE